MLQTPFFMTKEIMAKCAQLAQFDEELYKVIFLMFYGPTFSGTLQSLSYLFKYKNRYTLSLSTCFCVCLVALVKVVHGLVVTDLFIFCHKRIVFN